MRNALVLAVIAIAAAGCGRPEPAPEPEPPARPALKVFAESDRQWTGVAVTPEGRVFVNFPRWSSDVPISVAEVLGDGSLRPYPDDGWNSWTPDADATTTFVCVQSVVADGAGSLWVLDPANPGFQGNVPGGAKLIRIDTTTDEVVEVIFFDDQVAPDGSYLNDVRIDHGNRTAYISESGAGALVVVDLTTGASRRLLDHHPSTSAEETVLSFGGVEWRRPDGSVPKVHADGIAFDQKNDFIYYQALTGRTLYRIKGASLRDSSLDGDAVAAGVEIVASSGPSDGLLWDGGDGVFISAIEDDSIKRWTPAGGVETVMSDPMIAWPDSFARGPEGGLYVTTSQIHLGPNPPEPYRVLRITIE